MKFEVMRMQWAKRRKADKIKEVKSVIVIGFQKEQYHSCKMEVQFQDGESVSLIGQVSQNQVLGHWIVNGINGSGNQVAVKLIQ